MGLTLRWRSIKEALGALWNWFNVPHRGHLIDKRVKIPSANLRLHAPHRISSIASLFLCVKTLIGLAALCTGWRALPGLQD